MPPQGIALLLADIFHVDCQFSDIHTPEKVYPAPQKLFANMYDITDAKVDSLPNIEGTPLENKPRYEDLENSCEYLSDVDCGSGPRMQLSMC